MARNLRLDTVPQPRVGDEKVIATHNFCDKTTWFEQSARVTDESATDSGDGLTWNLANQFIIDLTHGKVHMEDDFASPYLVDVRVNGAQMVEADMYAGGGDYTVDYVAGAITFNASQAGKTVLATYSYAGASGYKLAPIAGKAIDIEHAEVQFSADCSFNDEIRFEVRMYAQAIEAMLGYPQGTIAPLNTVIPAKTYRYKTMANFVDEAMGAFPKVPTMAGEGGFNSEIYGFPFRYGTIRRLLNSHGAEVWLYLKNDLAFGGERATATLYCTTHNESDL